MGILAKIAAAALLALPLSASGGGTADPAAGTPGGPGLALRAAKVLTGAWEGAGVVDNAVLLVKDGTIEALGPAATTAIPVGYHVRDVGARWLIPGMIDLHSHVGGTFDINDMVYLTNPELRVSTSVVPNNPSLQRALASGVTTVLFIPGSGTNTGGQGVLVKTGEELYEDARVRDPGSLKVAQWGNPERWAIGVGKSFENYSIREMFRRGLAYARAWKDHEENGGAKPEVDLAYEVFRDLYAGRTQVSTHTQVYQVVLTTLTMIKREFGIDVYLDHSTIGGWLAGALAQELGVTAIVGPRQVDTTAMGGWLAGAFKDRIQGVAAGWQEQGLEKIGFNTDAPVIPAEELFLQSAMAARYGFDNSHLQALRGLTIVPAMAAGISGRVGSLEPGKDADVVVVTGDPSDPRTSVEAVYIEGRVVYDPATERRLF